MTRMDGMAKQVDKELIWLMQRKRTADNQDSQARQALRRQDIAARLAGDGYIATRFEDKYKNRPHTVL